MEAPLVVDIKANSLDDGPGIRSVVFLKGCPLSCTWCHNPESIRREAQLSFDAEACLHLGDCDAACPQGAVDAALPLRIDRARCTTCGSCASACASGALSLVGETLGVARIVERLRSFQPFYAISGGGVTLSGGEPTLYPLFCAALLRALRAEGIHTLLETCGHFAWEYFAAEIAPQADLIYFDLKLAADDAHRTHCGRTNRLILANARRLAARMRAGQSEVLFRIPLVPGITATDDNLAALAGFLRDIGATKAALLPFNPFWARKLSKLGRQRDPAAEDGGTAWMPADEMARCRSHFFGIELTSA